MNDDRDEIRRRLDIVELVSQRVRLKRSGKNYSGLCPFHDDKTPSFHVSPITGRYKCYACGESGDVFTWVMKTQGLEFREALKMLAEQAGVQLSNSFSGPKVDKTERDLQLATMQSALIFFRNELKRNTAAMGYLDGRDLDAGVQDMWELGYAPDVGEALAIHLNKEGRSLAMAESLFLTQQDRSGGYGDKFRGRIMFPIRDERGDLVGFGGRILGQGNPKYINSSETPLYNKSRVLYGMHRAKDRIMKGRHAVLVEGYMDVIACHRAGVMEAVASCGTALADGQVKLLKRFSDKVTILYDGDSAGQKAAERAIELFEADDLPCRVALLPKGEDPDTLLKTKGADAIRQVIQGAETPFDFRVRMLESRLGVDSEEFWQQIPTLLATAPNELAVEKHILRLAGLHPHIKNPTNAIRALRQDIRSQKRGKPRGQTSGKSSGSAIDTQVHSIHVAEGVILKALLHPELRAKFWPIVAQPELFATTTGKSALEALPLPLGHTPPTGPPAGWLASLENEAILQLFADLEFDVRFGEINEEYVNGSVESLRTLARDRELYQEKESLSKDDDAALRKFMDRLKGQKGVDD